MSDSTSSYDDSLELKELARPGGVVDKLMGMTVLELGDCISEDHSVAVVDGDRIDLVAFVSDRFETTDAVTTTSMGSFSQFMVVVTSLFDGMGSSRTVLGGNATLNETIFEGIVRFVSSLEMSTQRNHTIESLTCISNLFTVLVNYIRYERALDSCDRTMSTMLATSDKLVPFINETVHLIRVRVNGAITLDIRDAFRARLVNFWIAILDDRVLPVGLIDCIVLAFIRHEDVCMVVGYLLSQVEQDQEPALYLFHTLVTSEFLLFIRKDSWRGLREKFLSLAFVKMQGLIARCVLDATAEPSLEVMAILIEIVADPAFLSLLMNSHVHHNMLMAFMKALVQRSRTLFGTINILTDDQDDDEPLSSRTFTCHSRLLHRFSEILHTFYCCLTNTDKDIFINRLVISHDTTALREDLFVHLNEFASLSLFMGNHQNAKSNRAAFASIIARIKDVSDLHPPIHIQREAAPGDDGANTMKGKARSATHRKKLSDLDLDQYLIQTNYHLSAVSVVYSPSPSVAVMSHPLATLDDRFAAGLHSVAVQRLSSPSWTLGASRKIHPDQFLIEYTGVIMSWEQLCALDVDEQARVSATTPQCCIRLQDDQLLNASAMGSLARCLGHSCSPSAEVQRWVTNGVVHLFIFSTKEISPAEPITLDYQAAGIISAPFTCSCSSSSCSGRLVSLQALPWLATSSPTSAASSPDDSHQFNNALDALDALATAGSMLQAAPDATNTNKRRADEMESAAASKKTTFEPAPTTSASSLVETSSSEALSPSTVCGGPQSTHPATTMRYALTLRPGLTYAPPPIKTSQSTVGGGSDALLAFNRARRLSTRACSHVAIARGIQMHRNAIGASSTAVKIIARDIADQQHQYSQVHRQQPPPTSHHLQQRPMVQQQQLMMRHRPIDPQHHRRIEPHQIDHPQHRPIESQHHPIDPHHRQTGPIDAQHDQQQLEMRRQMYQKQLQYATMMRNGIGAAKDALVAPMRQRMAPSLQSQHFVPPVYAQSIPKQQYKNVAPIYTWPSHTTQPLQHQSSSPMTPQQLPRSHQYPQQTEFPTTPLLIPNQQSSQVLPIAARPGAMRQLHRSQAVPRLVRYPQQPTRIQYSPLGGDLSQAGMAQLVCQEQQQLQMYQQHMREMRAAAAEATPLRSPSEDSPSPPR